MQDVCSATFIGTLSNWAIVIPLLLVLIGALIVYLVLMVRAIIDMLRHNAHRVLLTFAFLALIPLPLFVILGISVLVIWHYYKMDVPAWT